MNIPEMKYVDDPYEYEMVLEQEYSQNNCKFSTGFVKGHPVDTMYLRLVKDGEEPTTLLFRPDEMAAIAWLVNGVLWSEFMKKRPEFFEKD